MSSRRNVLVLIQIVLTLTCVLISLCLLWNRTTTDYSAQSKVTESRSLHSSVSCTFEEKESPKNFQGDSELKCSIGYVPKRGEKVCVECPKGKFSLSNWIACEPLLNCDALRHEVNIGELRHGLVHWTYYSADWNGYEVIYVRFNPLAKTKIDYTSLQSFSPSQYFMYPIGFCETDKTFIFASNATFVGTLAHKELFAKNPACNTCKIKFNLILSYLHILSRLHANRRVLCNSRTLDNLVAQFLVSSDFKLVFATLDNLQSDAYEGVLCYLSEQAGTFVAPEQNWPFGATKIFNAMEQPRSDIKSDVWKVPDMVSFILAGTCSYVLDYVQDSHLLCKSVSPQARPNASHLLEEYRRIGVLVFSEI